MAVQINQSTYGFIQSIATQFDQQRFPTVKCPSLILDPKKDGLKWPIDQKTQTVLPGRTTRLKIADVLPAELVGEVTSHADNFSEWVVILGLTDPKVQMSAAALNYSARSLLAKMKINRNEQSALDQLLTHVFEEAFSKSSADEQIKCINLMSNCGSVTESYSFKCRYVYFKVQSAVAAFFSNQVVQVAVGVVVAWQTRKAVIFAKAYFDRTFRTYYVPKMVNIFIKHAPLQAVKVASIFIRVVGSYIKYVLNHPFRVQIYSWIIVKCSGPYKPLAERIETIALLPITIPRTIASASWNSMFKAFSVSQSIQTRLATATKTASDNSQNRLIDENRDKAYQLWMYLMKNPTLLYASSAA